MGIAEDILVRCEQVLEESSKLLLGSTITKEEIKTRQKAANIASEAAFLLLQKAFITPYNREDLWDFWHACEAVWKEAAVLAVTGKAYQQAATACRALGECARALQQRLPNMVSLLALAEQQFCEIEWQPPLSLLAKGGQNAVFCLQRLLLKNT